MTLSKRVTPVALLVAVAVAMAALPITTPARAAHSSAGVSGKVGFLFSDFTTSARWQFDKSYFIAAMKKLDPNVQVVVYDAKNAQTNQQNEAKSALTAGVKVLLDVPVDSAQAAAIVREAHANSPSVPVIAYDRLITGANEDAYASFDGFSVGKQQGMYLKQHVKKGGTIVEIAGAPTDNNAHLFHNGARSVLNPLIKSGHFKLGYFKFTPGWDAATAQQEMASALNKLNNKVDGVLVANDGMADGVIKALTNQHLNGKVVVTGQDATAAGLQEICLGNQSMTVYKPIKQLAPAAARITDAFLHGKKWTSKLMTPTGAGKTPTFLGKVTTVTKANYRQTVIKDGYVKKSEVPQCYK